MQAKLTQAKVHWDSWFTGVDFPDAALRAISSAARRRKLGGLLKYFLVLLCILKFDILSFKLYHVHKPTDILGMEASQHSSLAGRVTYPLHPGSCKSASFNFFTFGLFPPKKLGLKQLQEQSLLPCEVYQEELPRPLHVQRHDELCERPRCQEAETGFLDSTGFFGFVFFLGGPALFVLFWWGWFSAMLDPQAEVPTQSISSWWCHSCWRWGPTVCLILYVSWLLVLPFSSSSLGQISVISCALHVLAKDGETGGSCHYQWNETKSSWCVLRGQERAGDTWFFPVDFVFSCQYIFQHHLRLFEAHCWEWGWIGSFTRTCQSSQGTICRNILLRPTSVKALPLLHKDLANQWTGKGWQNLCLENIRKTLARLRVYRIFYKKRKYNWVGPPLRALLKLVAPHQKLQMTAEDMYFMTDEQQVPHIIIYSNLFMFFVFWSQDIFSHKLFTFRWKMWGTLTGMRCDWILLRLSSREPMNVSMKRSSFMMLGLKGVTLLVFLSKIILLGSTPARICRRTPAKMWSVLESTLSMDLCLRSQHPVPACPCAWVSGKTFTIKFVGFGMCSTQSGGARSLNAHFWALRCWQWWAYLPQLTWPNQRELCPWMSSVWATMPEFLGRSCL